MRHMASAIALLLGLSACSGEPTIYDGEDQVKAHLRDPGSAEFSEVKAYKTGKGRATIVCGQVNSRNGWAG